jgi:hypothetical protein
MAPSLAQSAIVSGAQDLVFADMGVGGISGDASAAVGVLFNATGVPIVASHRSPDGFVPSGVGGDGLLRVVSRTRRKEECCCSLLLRLSTGLSRSRGVLLFSYPAA